MIGIIRKRKGWFFLPSLLLATAVLSAVILSCGLSQKELDERIQTWYSNSQFWQYQKKPVLLLGGSDEDNLFNHPDLMKRNYALLEKIGGNYIRCTLSCRDEGNVWPFLKKAERYDLNRFNPEFWERLDLCLKEAKKRDIIVQIEIWATFDYYREFWKINPFNPLNNSNYTSETTHLKTEWDHHPASKVQPFFDSIPLKNNDKELLRFQEAFVRKVLEVSLPYPNVLYCLDNETRASEAWAFYWAEFIHKVAGQQGIPVQLTEMWDQWDISGEDHKRTCEHPEFFSYVETSQNNWQTGQTHYDKLRWIKEQLSESNTGSRPINNVKVYGRTRPGEPCIPELNLERWWQNIFAGCASSRFHRPESGLGLNETAQQAIAAARTFFREFNFFQAVPRLDILLAREENEAYCLMIPYNIFAVYFPKGGEVNLKIIEPKTYQVRWFDTQTAQFLPPENATAPPDRKEIPLKAPAADRTWLVLIQ